MPAIIAANETLTKGGLAVLSRSYQADQQGKVIYKAKYCCLSSFARDNAMRFRVGAPPPTPAPSSLSALQLFRPPTLYDISISSENGLTYFDASYDSATVGEYIVTETDTLTEFSASSSPQNTEIILSISFKYYSKTIEISASNTYVTPSPPDIGLPFDIRGGGVGYRKDVQLSKSLTSSSRGVGFSYNTRAVSLYVATTR